MKRFCFLFLLLALAAAGCAHNNPVPVTSRIVDTGPQGVAAAQQPQPKVMSPDAAGSGQNSDGARDTPAEGTKSELSSETSEKNGDDEYNDEKGTVPGDGEEKPAASISDPIEKFNRAMFTFNDKLYYWVLKPVAQGYKKVVPEEPRVSVSNFFNNLGFPVRFVSMLLQADFSGAVAELGRFTVNTVWGIGGLMDAASTKQLQIPKKDADLGQTLGLYGVGQGFYIVWPLLGPSSARDSVDIPGEYFLNPLSYVMVFYETAGVKSYQAVNDTSLRIGDYEALTEAAIDPYIAMRDAYAQYRLSKVEAARGKAQPTRPAGVRVGQLGYPEFSVMESLNLREDRGK